MLSLLIDFAVLFGLLSYFSERDLKEELPRLAIVTFGISVVGSIASFRIALASHWSIGLVAYFIFGTLILAGLAKVSPKTAAIIMAIFVVYRIVLKGALIAIA